MRMRILGLLTRKGRLKFKRYRKILSTLAFAVVLGSLTIVSAIIVHSRVPPLWKEVPVIGIIGFIVSGLIGFGLLIKIIRNRGFEKQYHALLRQYPGIRLANKRTMNIIG